MTNAVLCLPLDANGRNRRPGTEEISNCNRWLRATIDALAPHLVVGMGTVALAALKAIEPHALTVSSAGEEPVRWRGTRLAAVYHPAARAQVHRRWESQMADWAALGAWAAWTFTRGHSQ